MKNKVEEIRNIAINIIPDLFSLIFKKINIKNLESFKFRIKLVDSYIKRMQRLNCKIDEVDDLIGLCFIFKDIKNCYELLNQIKLIKELKIIEVRDYIKKPCGINKYQAIHLKFKFENSYGEIQLKTIKMQEESDKGYKKYKDNLKLNN